MKFKYQKRPTNKSNAHPERYSVLRPIIPIRLWNGDNFIDTDALIDSGADDCVFSAEIGEVIGLNIRNGKDAQYKGVGGEIVNVYFHNINLGIGGHKFDCCAGFSYDTAFKEGLLGQNGFFNLFSVILNLIKEEIELKGKTKL